MELLSDDVLILLQFMTPSIKILIVFHILFVMQLTDSQDLLKFMNLHVTVGF